MLETAEPGFSIDVGVNSGETLRNACTEVSSHDDSDICNLGSINMARINTLEDFRECVRLGTMFLLAGTLYSDIPYLAVGDTRTKNRRLGLGLMGIHEWLLQRGHTYGPCEELTTWMEAYRESTEIAHKYADEWGISRPVKTRAIAPTGTISIVAETTSGIEPIFCVAFRRRYIDGTSWKYQYVLDPTATRLIENSDIKPELVEDAYSLSEDLAAIERRVAFQAYLQQYVDHGISSTLNLPPWGSEVNNENTVDKIGDMLLRYLPKLRGITAYPDGCRGGQPLTRVKYETAIGHVGQVFVEGQDICDINGKGSCGA
jgi:ribonucleoside-diphosphate reductase alpha chain